MNKSTSTATIIAFLILGGLLFTYKNNNTKMDETKPSQHEVASTDKKDPIVTTQENAALKDQAKPVAAVTENDRVVAKYNGKTIMKSEVNNKLKVMFNGELPGGKNDFDQLDDNLRENILKNFVIAQLVDEEATKMNIQQTPEYKEQLVEVTKQLAEKVFVDQKIKENVTDAKLRDEYANFAAKQSEKEEVKAKHILVKSEEEAKKISDELKNGASFDELAKSKSLDSNKDKGGDLGYFGRGQMVPAFENTVFAMKVGDVSAPVKTDFGWHIIKLEDKRKATVPTFDEIKSKLQRDLSQKYVQDYIGELQKNSKMELFAKPESEMKHGEPSLKPSDSSDKAASDSNKKDEDVKKDDAAPANESHKQ